MISIERLTEATTSAHEDLAKLSSELHDDTRVMSQVELKEMLAQSCMRLMVARDGEKIIGMASLYIFQKVGSRSGLVEDVIVDSTYRGQGLGEKLMLGLIDVARNEHLKSISLTSRSVRVAAHKLYTKLGFAVKETTVFKLTL